MFEIKSQSTGNVFSKDQVVKVMGRKERKKEVTFILNNQMCASVRVTEEIRRIPLHMSCVCTEAVLGIKLFACTL